MRAQYRAVQAGGTDVKILRNLRVPTGNILVVQGDEGTLELLSVGDYGKDVNIKADFLGLSREPASVVHTALLPLEEKWVITISTQYGCSMGCTFCDVPLVGPGKNATLRDLVGQVLAGIGLHPEVQNTKRLNVHFARMGEPTWNPEVLECARWLKTHIDSEFRVHPVVSTMMPRKNIWLRTFVHTWMRLKNRMYDGNAGLQISLNSTSEEERRQMFSGNACTLKEVSAVMEGVIPKGRKITLNFAIAGYEINPQTLREYFSPELYLCKLTPMHKTLRVLNQGILTEGDPTCLYPYREDEERLKRAGYQVLVFLASEVEDASRITCGNAILSGTEPGCEYEELSVAS